MRLSTSQHRWLLRRTIHITFDDALTLCKESTLDVSLTRLHWPDDRWTPFRLPTQGGRVLLPITSFPIGEHFDVSVRDVRGESLPIVPRSTERMLLAAGYAQISIEEDRDPTAAGGSWEERYEKILDLLLSDPPPGDQILSLPADSEPWMSHLNGLEFFLGYHLIIATPLFEDVFGGTKRWNTDTSLFRLTETHSESIPGVSDGSFDAEALREYRKERHAILRWATSSTNPVEVTTAVWEEPRGLDDYVIEIPIRETNARSVHVNVQVPEGTFIDSGTLVVVNKNRRQPMAIYQIADDDVHWNTAHFLWPPRFASGSGHSDDVGSGFILYSRALLILRPMYAGSMRAPTFLAAASWGTLVILTLTIGWNSAKLPAPVHLRLSNSPDDPVTVLLLGALTVALGVMIRFDEHPMSRAVADRFRGRLALVCFGLFVGTLAIAIGLEGRVLFGVLVVSWVIALPFLIGLVRQARYSRGRGNVKPAPSKPE